LTSTKARNTGISAWSIPTTGRWSISQCEGARSRPRHRLHPRLDLRRTGLMAVSNKRRSPAFSQCERKCLAFLPTGVTCRWKQPAHWRSTFLGSRVFWATAPLLSRYPDGSLGISPARWKDTRILLPRELEGYGFSSALTGEEITPTDRAFAVAQILSDLPVA